MFKVFISVLVLCSTIMYVSAQTDCAVITTCLSNLGNSGSWNVNPLDITTTGDCPFSPCPFGERPKPGTSDCTDNIAQFSSLGGCLANTGRTANAPVFLTRNCMEPFNTAFKNCLQTQNYYG